MRSLIEIESCKSTNSSALLSSSSNDEIVNKNNRRYGLTVSIIFAIY